MKNTDRNTMPVLIAGAGPTGLTLATVLARYGVPVRVIEKKAGLSRHTKATNLMQRNQELMFALGLLDPLNEIGGHMRRMMVHAYGKSFGPRTMRLTESPFTDVILCGQHNFEAVVARGLSDLGVEVEFTSELTGLSQTAEGVTATVVKNGHREDARFSYAVGCDGHAGVTRTFTRLDFQPKKTGAAIRQVDCKLSWRRLSGMEQMWLFYFNRGFAVVVPLPGDVTRVLIIEPREAFPEREPTLAEMQDKLREVAEDSSLTLTDPDWFSYTDLSMGIAPALRDGRIFLAGDAGNPVLPNGGQGMNTGIADAFNLGWKLAAVHRHGAGEALLNTYNEERHALRTALQKFQFNSLKYTTLVTPGPMQAAFRLLAEPILNWGGEYKMARAFSELAIHTRKSSLTLEGAGRKGLRAGGRALDAPAIGSAGATRIYDLIYRGGWTLLAFTGRGRHADPAAVSRAMESVARSGVSAYLVSTDSRLDATPHLLYDLDEEAHRTYDVKRPTLFLVRPDGHVGCRVGPDRAETMAAYLQQWVPDASQAFGPRASNAIEAALRPAMGVAAE